VSGQDTGRLCRRPDPRRELRRVIEFLNGQMIAEVLASRSSSTSERVSADSCPESLARRRYDGVQSTIRPEGSPPW
jgi:hypothetical protein